MGGSLSEVRTGMPRSIERQFDPKLLQSQATQGRGCRKGRPSCLSRDSEKTRGALNKLSRTFLISVLKKQTPMALSRLGGTNDSLKALNFA